MHGGTDLVAHVGQKVRLELLTLLVGSDQAGLGRLTLREITRDLAKSDMDAVLINRCDDDVGPEAGAVLLVAPALVLDTAFAKANVKFHFWLLDIEVFFAVEDGEMFSDDLFPGVALEQLSTRVPCRDVTLCIKQEDRVVLKCLNKNAESFVGGETRLDKLVVEDVGGRAFVPFEVDGDQLGLAEDGNHAGAAGECALDRNGLGGALGSRGDGIIDRFGNVL